MAYLPLTTNSIFAIDFNILAYQTNVPVITSETKVILKVAERLKPLIFEFLY